MEQITITKPDNSTYKLGSVVPLTVITRAEQSQTLMGDDKVEIEVISNVAINFGVGDSIMAYGRKYILMDLPAINRVSDTHLQYNLTFGGGINQLFKVLYKLDGDLGTAGTSDFVLMANLDRFVTLLVLNLNAVYGAGTWVKGAIDATEERNLTFSNETCQAVLTKLADEYAMEYYIDYVSSAWVINTAAKIGRDLPDVYKYGQGLGLLYVNRKFVSEDTFTTKVYAFGSMKNLPSDYRNYTPRLKMPAILNSDVDAPSVPIITLSFQHGTVRLSWTASTDNVGVIGYEIYVSEDRSVFAIDSIIDATFKDFTYILGHGEMGYKIKAVDAARNKSRASNTVYLAANNNIDAPSLTSLTESPIGVLVQWSSPLSNTDQIEVWRTSGSLDYALIATLNGNTNSYNDLNVVLHPVNPIYYKLRAVGSYFYSNFSNVLGIVSV